MTIVTRGPIVNNPKYKPAYSASPLPEKTPFKYKPKRKKSKHNVDYLISWKPGKPDK